MLNCNYLDIGPPASHQILIVTLQRYCCGVWWQMNFTHNTCIWPPIQRPGVACNTIFLFIVFWSIVCHMQAEGWICVFCCLTESKYACVLLPIIVLFIFQWSSWLNCFLSLRLLVFGLSCTVQTSFRAHKWSANISWMHLNGFRFHSDSDLLMCFACFHCAHVGFLQALTGVPSSHIPKACTNRKARALRLTKRCIYHATWMIDR